MVPDDSLTIRQRAIAAWPTAWGGQNQRDILVSLGYDVDRPWRDLPKKDRDWILYTDEQPTVPVYAGFTPEETRRALKRKEEPSYQGTFTGVKRYVLHTFANTQSALTRKRVSQYLISTECPLCHGKRLRRESLSVKFAGLDIADMSALSLIRLAGILRPTAEGTSDTLKKLEAEHPEKAIVAQRIAQDLVGTNRRDARPRPRLSFHGAQHAHAFARRAPASAPGHASPLQFVWCRVCAR